MGHANSRLLAFKILFTLFVFCCGGSFAGELEADVDRTEVQVADPFRLNISLTAPKDTDVTFSPVPESLGSFQVNSHRDFFDIPLDGNANQRIWKRVIELESYESGSLEVPGMVVVVGGESKSTRPIAITVKSSLDASAEATSFRELKDVEEITVDDFPWRNWILVGVGILALLGAIGWFARGRQKPPLTAEAWAYQQLDTLATSRDFARREQTIVLPRAADILRGYIQRRFYIQATQLTTDEFLKRIQTSAILAADQKADLQEFLRHTDMIKFAHLIPESDQLSQALQRVRTFVARSDGQSQVAKKGTADVLAR